MCGIAGFVDTKMRIGVGELVSMNNVAKYRGPDDEGYYLVERSSVGYECYGDDTVHSLRDAPYHSAKSLAASCQPVMGLAHRRLSILDVTAAGHQPMMDAASQCVLVFNGELYNYIEVRDQLIALGHEFSTHSDTEVLLRSYLEWGEHCVDHFNGMWGFCIWDEGKKRLFCSRDRLGAKPFHWWTDGHSAFCFGSELKQVAACSLVDRALNVSYVASNVIYGVSDYDHQTPLAHVEMLNAGHNLIVQMGHDMQSIVSVRKERYWNLSVESKPMSAEECVDRIRQEVSRSCSWRMRSDVPLGVLLSGGLDSSCLTAELADQLHSVDPDARLSTFTTSYEGYPDCDERVFAQAVNQAKNCIGHMVEPSFAAHDVGEKMSDLVWHLEGMCNPTNLGTLSLLEQVRDAGFKVLINGQCGDETMFGYERYYAYYLKDLVGAGRIVEAFCEGRRAVDNSRLTFKELAAMTGYYNMAFLRQSVRRRESERYCSGLMMQACDDRRMRELLFPGSLSGVTYNELTSTQLPHITRWDDRLYMAASLESRIPFMDYQFVEFACSIPPSLKIQGGWTKYLLRKAFDGRLPDSVIWRKNKMGFPAPREAWMKKLPESFALSLAKEARSAPLFDMGAVGELCRNNRGSKAFERFLWVELFMRRFEAYCPEL